MFRRHSYRALAFLTAVGWGLLLTPAAATAAPNVTLTTSTDPIEDVAAQVITTGTVDAPSGRVYVTRKPAGGVGCAANSAADTGDLVVERSLQTGPYTSSTNETFRFAGDYLLCAWLTDTSQPGSPVVATTSLTVTIRVPRLALSVSAPATVGVGDTFQVVTTSQAETTRATWVWIVPDSGRGCPANASAADDPGVIVV